LDQASKEIGALRIAIGRCMTDEITYSMTNYMEMNATKISAPRPWDLNKDLNVRNYSQHFKIITIGKTQISAKILPLTRTFRRRDFSLCTY